MFKWMIVVVAVIPMFAMSQVSGPLRVSGVNPRYLVSTTDTNKAIWLGGFHLWSNAQDGGNSYPPTVVSMRKYWDSLSANRSNFVRLWAGWEQPAGLIETSNNWYWEPLPFKRTGPGNARDGRLKFNLDSLNDAFYARMYTYCDSLQRRGIYVAVQLFDGWSNAYPNHSFSAGNPWNYHPYNSANNVNSVNGDPNSDGSGLEVHFSPYGGGGGISAVWNHQWKYIKKFLDTLNVLDNIMWEVCNEAEGQGQYAWHRLVIDSIHAYESRKPKRHVVWHTGDWGILNDSLFAGPGEAVAPGAGNNGTQWQTNPRDMGGSKVVIVDTDHLWGMVYDNQVPWVWKNFCNGNSVTLQDNFCSNPAFPYWDCDNTYWPAFRRAMGVAVGLGATTDLLHMTPQPNKSSTSDDVLFGAATGEVIVYQASGNISVDLTEIPGTVNVTWYDPDDFISLAGTATTGGALRTFSPPDARYDVLYLQAGAFALSPPTLLAPSNGSTGVATNATLTWNASSGATSYRVQVSTDAGFATTVVDQSNVTTTSLALSSLAANTLYYWHVSATNSGGTSAYSASFTFTTSAPPPPPSSPVLATPANGATGVATNPTLTWNASSGATSYRVQVSTVSGFTATVVDQSNVTTTSFAASSLVANTLYYWRVSATNSGGTSAFSGAFNFTTAAAPTTAAIYQNAALSTPWNDMRSYSVTRTYSNTTPVYEGASSLRLAYSAWGSLQFNQGSWSSFVSHNPAQYQSLDFAIHGGTSGATISVRCLNSSGGSMATVVVTVPANTWQLKSIPMSQLATAPFVAIEFASAVSVTCYLDIVDLTPAGATLPSSPVLATPANGSTGVATNATLTWNASSGATSYRVQVSTDAGFATTVVDQSNVTTTSLALSSLAANTLYYWHVSATNSGGTSAYSASFTFTTSAPPPPPSSPVLATPANGATGVATNSTLTWNASSGATSYRVQVSTVSGFTTTVVDQSNVTTTSFALSSLVANTLYYWRVSATNSGGTSAYATSRNFTTAAAPTTAAIYQNAALSSPWSDMRSYSVTRTYSNTTPIYEGASSLRLAYSAWGSLQFGQGNWGSFVSLNPAQYQSLDFAIHGGTSGATISVRCLNSSGGSMATVVVAVPANTWQLKSIPMSQLATAPFVAIEFGSAVSVTCYLDIVGLTPATQPTILIVTVETQDEAVEAKRKPGTKLSTNDGIEEFVKTYERSDSSSNATTLRVSAIGGGSLVYQWQRDGVDISGATNDLYILRDGDTTGMRCVVSNLFGADTSNEVLVSHGLSSINSSSFNAGKVVVNEQPLHYALEQNYPNPFNPSTTIRYNLPNASHVSLKLFNTLGQEVATLVSEGQEAGYKSVEWNASGFASGIYFYRLQAGEFVQTRRLLLLR